MSGQDQALTNGERSQVEMLGLVPEPVAANLWLIARQHKLWRPPTDVYETDTHVIVKVEIGGMEEHEFSISLDAQTLTIRGARHDPADKLAYQQMEIPYGEFETIVSIQATISADPIQATYSNGFLSVLLPKAAPRRIPVVRRETPG